MVVPRTDVANSDHLESLSAPLRYGAGGGTPMASHEEPENIQIEVEREEGTVHAIKASLAVVAYCTFSRI